MKRPPNKHSSPAPRSSTGKPCGRNSATADKTERKAVCGSGTITKRQDHPTVGLISGKSDGARVIAEARPRGTVASDITRARKIETYAIERIFRDAVGNKAMPSAELLDDVASKLSRPWVREFRHGPWKLMLAIRVILDDAPVAAEAELRSSSKTAEPRATAYANLARVAQHLQELGVRIPEEGDSPPTTNQAISRANPNHREWKAAFGAVSQALIGAGWTKIGMGQTSPAVIIASGLLENLGVYVEPETLSKMLQRSVPPRKSKKDK